MECKLLKKVAVKITRNYGIEEENRMHVAKV